MSREKAAYRDQLERLIEFFPDQEIVTQADVMRFTRRSDKWVRTRLGVKAVGVTLPVLARRLLALCGE